MRRSPSNGLTVHLSDYLSPTLLINASMWAR
jgi:hypothetical protein